MSKYAIDPSVRQELAVRMLVARIARWQGCMSYNDSYFGEPRGLLKGVINELRHVLDLGDADYAPWKERDEKKRPR
jgi:hypothetical protein